MYVPKHFSVDDAAWQARHMAEHSFATVVSSDGDGVPFASHLPLTFRAGQGERGTLRGHMAKPNEQWRHFESGREVLCIFHGPHAYASPSWYANQPAVPTWLYTAVHVYGRPVLLDEDKTRSLVWELAAIHDGGDPRAMALSMQQEAAMIAAIVGFDIEISRIEGKAKLSQNKKRADRDGTIAALEEQGGENSLALAAAMRANQDAA
jgi:transcriptional regulator